MGKIIQFPDKKIKKLLDTAFSHLEIQTQEIEEMSIKLEQQSEELLEQTQRILELMMEKD
ncbi:MAG: hypothetical protein CMO97_02690 [Woeseia sp.]|nr:hypothetical protein [Woeseia sp.]|tara:strand:+ start:1428 stop:1607 length:180 start_codon:yes stop_codon:yes gene_type:complete